MRMLGGILVGGRATRMGGLAKGLLLTPDGESIVVRTRRLFDEVGLDCVLVGAHPAYRDLGLEVVADAPSVEGPLGGILALLERAADRSAIAVACDMPFITKSLLQRLVDAAPAPIVAPRRRDPDRGGDVWEPLFARYDASVLPSARAYASEGGKKLQRLLDLAGARALTLTQAEEAALIDWDILPATAARDSKEE